MTTRSSTSSSPPAPSPSGEHLDLFGEVCPYTFVRTRLALEALPLGAELTVTLDHPPAARNVPRSAREWGQEVAAVDEIEPGRWLVRICKRVP